MALTLTCFLINGNGRTITGSRIRCSQAFASRISGTGQVVNRSGKCDELALVFFFPGGLNRTDSQGEQEEWQVGFDLEFRAAGGAWTGFFADVGGKSARHSGPAWVKRHQIRRNQRLILNAKTAEPFFLYVQRKVARAKHDVRLWLRQETYYLKADGTDPKGARQGKNHWPRDRWEIAGERDDTDTGAIASDPQLVQFAAFRDEPAVENFEPKLSGIDLTLNDQTTKSARRGPPSPRS